jgi:hypothetical protein
MTMDAKTVQCPRCGNSGTGAYCSHCGAPLAGRALFARWNAQAFVPWAALGLATIALAVSLMAWLDRGGGEPPPGLAASSESAAAAFSAPGAPVDLSSMTPRQAADRLFNRVMAASERGDRVEAMRFVPMALQAYDNLGTLDNDARFHVALIHLVAGDTAKARVQIESLRKSVPGHLLASMLEYQIAVSDGNEGAALRANRTFLAAYDAEIAVRRSEYQDHQDSINRFREAAQASPAARK